jgi:hypothetical protein
MSWTVVWKPAAERTLAQLWLDSPQRSAIAHAADEIDARLRHDPLAQGESRRGNRSVMFVSPLAVHYEVLPDDCLVRVLKVLRVPDPF